jgi:hypothetical protein
MPATNDAMHVPKGESKRFQPLSGEEMSKTMNQYGTLLRKEEIKEMREKQGFCPTCIGTPVKLYEVRKAKLNPLWKSREPLTVPNESYKGQCLKCHPTRAASGDPTSDSLRLSQLSEKTQGTSSRPAFLGGILTVIKFDNSKGSMLDQVESSFHTTATGDRVSDSIKTTLTEEQGLESFKTAQEFSAGGKFGELNDSVTSQKLRGSSSLAGKRAEPAGKFNRRKSPPLKLSGIPPEARNDSLDVSRRDSVPLPLGPVVESKAARTLKKISQVTADDAEEQQQILAALNKNRRVAKPVKPDCTTKPSTQVKPIKKPTDTQAAETMDRLRAAYERTFCSNDSAKSLDDISALTLEIEHSNSMERKNPLERSNNSGGISLDSDSLLEEFSVPDFSMGTGDAVKSHRLHKPEKPKSMIKSPVSRQKPRLVPLDAKRVPEKPRKPPPPPPPKMSYEEFAVDFGPSDGVCKPKATKPVATLPKNEFATSRKYAMMDSGVLAIPGPPKKLAFVPRIGERPRHPPAQPAAPSSFGALKKTAYPVIPSMPSYDEGSALPLPSLADEAQEPFEELTVETKTAGDIASLDSKLEEVEALISDVVAAENPEFLAELLSNTMRTHRDREDIQVVCLHTIWDASRYNFENKGIIMQAGLYECIISSMKDFPDSVRVQENGCGALWSLSVNQFNRVILVRAGACERVLRSLDYHLNDEGFVQTALGALRTLSPEREARMVINHMLGSQRVVRAMGLHRLVVDIQRDGCAFLSNVAVDMHNQQVNVVSREELQAVVRAMRDHLKNESVITSACFTLKNLSYEEQNLRNLRRFDDVVSLLEDAAQYATKASCRRDATEILKRIEVLQTEDEALEETAFSSLMQAIRRTSTEKNPAKQIEESVAVVTDVIQEYDWSIRLICFGFESLLSLADKSEAYLNRMLSPKTLRVIVTTMREHASNPKVQQRGCDLLRFLAEPNNPVNRMEICMEEGCSVLVGALRNHHGDESVEIPAYTALKSLAEEPMCADEIQRSGGWQIIREHEEESTAEAAAAAAEDLMAGAVEELEEVAQLAEEGRLARGLSAS